MSTTPRKIVLLDGSMGQELVNRSGKEPTPMWATQALVDDPGMVKELHRDYIDAGARVLTVNTYACTPERLKRHGIPERFDELQGLALQLVTEARAESGREADVSIAGCLPPLISSYHPENSPGYQESFDTYSQIIEVQADFIDCLLCETVSSIADAKAVGDAANASGKPVWLALSVSDENPQNLRSGEPLEDAQVLLTELGVEMHVLNCSRPESIDSVFAGFTARANHSGAYANGFSAVDKLGPHNTVAVLETRKDLGPDAYADFAMKWVNEGASMVGGCCEVGPAHIAKLAEALEKAGHTLTNKL